MYSFTLYNHKNLLGNLYTFPNRGDGIPMHSHSNTMLHNVIVLSGSIEVYGPDKQWSKTLVAGDIINLELEHNPHEIAALVPNTRVLGLWTNLLSGTEAGNLEKSGSFETPLTIPLND